MSLSAYWEPVIRQKRRGLSYEAVCLLRESYDAPSFAVNPVVLTTGDVDRLHALAVGRELELRDDLYALIEAIEKHGAVRLWEEK